MQVKKVNSTFEVSSDVSFFAYLIYFLRFRGVIVFTLLVGVMVGFEGADQDKPADHDDCGTHRLRYRTEFRSVHDLDVMLCSKLISDFTYYENKYILHLGAKLRRILT